ncbi:MAG: hypothetical protein IT423_09485 [Pirellulaceae bacterium]|nr:hypothetical protein [Pirellulaceae bacterium]
MTPSQVSWPALADATWQARQATALTVVHRENVEDAVDFTPDVPAMLAALGTQTGLVDAQLESSWPIADARVRNLAAVASSYPASQPTLAATALGLAPSGKAAGGASGVPSVIDGLVMQLRAGRPTVVLVDDVVGMSSGSNLLQDAVAQAMLLAASDDARTAWLQHELRLAPWTASKLFATTGTERADFTITHDLLLRDSGLTVSDVLAPVFGWQGLTTRNAGLRCLQLGSGGNAARQNLFHTGDRHADTQRMVDLSKIGNLQLVMGRVHRDRAWQRLAPNPLNAEEDLSSWLNKLELIIEKTPRPEVGAALLNLAESCLLAEHWSRWQAVLDRASTYAPLTDTARWSTLATLRFGASDERLAWEMTTQSQADQPRKSDDQLAQSGGKTRLPSATDSTPFERDGRPSTVVTANAELASGNASSGGGLAPSVRTVAAEMPIEARQAAGQVKQVAALRAVVNQFNQMAELDKGLVLRPDVQLAHFARRRALAELAGEPVPDAGALQLMAQATNLAGWQQAADQEAVLASGRATLPAWTARAVRAVEPPRLDGKPNDACWQAAQTIELTSPFHQVEQTVGPAKVRFCYDADYLYVWMECPQAPNWQGQQPPDSKAPRRYDMNLDGSDHVVFSLDTDRDYTSACELAVNEAGQTYDRCCLSSHWNPHWYVDVDLISVTHNQAGLDTQTGLVSQAGPGSQPGKWSAEFAVKLSDLTMAPSVAGRVWAISVFRYLPQWDVQSWSQLRSYNPRQQGNGLLMFLP